MRDRSSMSNTAEARPRGGKELISLAQQLARDAERHALLSASLASQADRLMVAGLRLLDRRALDAADPRGSRYRNLGRTDDVDAQMAGCALRSRFQAPSPSAAAVFRVHRTTPWSRFPGRSRRRAAPGHFFTCVENRRIHRQDDRLAANLECAAGSCARRRKQRRELHAIRVFSSNNFASLNVQALGGQIISGQYCALIYDVGTITSLRTTRSPFHIPDISISRVSYGGPVCLSRAEILTSDARRGPVFPPRRRSPHTRCSVGADRVSPAPKSSHAMLVGGGPVRPPLADGMG